MKKIFRFLQLVKLRMRCPVGTVLFLAIVSLSLGQLFYGTNRTYVNRCSKIIRVDYNPSTECTDPFYRLSLSNGCYVEIDKIGHFEVGDTYHQRVRKILGRKSLKNDKQVTIICSLMFIFLIWLLCFPTAIVVVNGKFLTIRHTLVDGEGWSRDVEYLSIISSDVELFKTENLKRFYTWSETNIALNECYKYINHSKYIK